MIDGLYKVEFGTQLGAGTGVVHLRDGRVWGGDMSLYYVGTYTLDGDRFAAEVRTDKHSTVPGLASVFGIDRVNIRLNGSVAGNSIRTNGTAAEAPGVSFQAHLTRLAD